MLSLVCALALGSTNLTVSVLTFGPGDHPFFKFGHNAVWIHDNETRADRVYNYGMFAFDSPLLIPEFLKGRLKYWVAEDSLNSTVAVYRYENRTIQAQELDLTDAEKLEIAEALRVNALPENKYYKYDYYMDNCSTRVRDVVDRAIKGAVHDFAHDPAEMTWRMHTRRLTQDSLFVYLALDIVMADFIDKPIDQWAEMFLPSKLEEGLAKVQRNGTPLVKQERPLLRAPGRPPLPTAPPDWHLWFVLWGVLGGALWFVPQLRIPMRITAGVFGFFGCTFLMFWLFTDHAVAWHNENIFLCAPWAIAFFGLGKKRLHTARRLAVGAAVFAVLALLLKVLPSMDQRNSEFICFFIPYWAGAAIALTRAERHAK